MKTKNDTDVILLFDIMILSLFLEAKAIKLLKLIQTVGKENKSSIKADIDDRFEKIEKKIETLYNEVIRQRPAENNQQDEEKSKVNFTLSLNFEKENVVKPLEPGKINEESQWGKVKN